MSREALVVGINRYPLLKDSPTSKPRHLLKPAADAEAIAKFLENYGNFRVQRFPTINIDENWQVDANPAPRNLPKITDLETAISKLFNPPSSTIPDTALLFFAGHGLRKNQGGVTEGFLATSDANPQRGKWGLSLYWLRQLLESSPVRQQIVWLDCCHSGELLNFAEADPGNKGKARDRCLIAASRDFEVAYEEFSGEHGVLTSALLKALNPENYADSWVTNYSLVDYINKQLSTSRQRPIFHNSGGEIILTGEKEKIDRAVLMAGVCPYKGLESFDFNEEDPQYFYGRTALTDLLLDKVREGNFLAVLGASGSGKSSVVKAGLLHQLKLGQRLSGSDNWPILIFRPGEHPLKSLAQVFVKENLTPPTPLPCEGRGEKEFLPLAGEGLGESDSPPLAGEGLGERSSQLEKASELIATGAVGLSELVTSETRFLQENSETRFLQETGFLSRRLVLVVDQFEECFTLCRDTIEREKFFECILGALEQTNNQLCLIITMRADFFGKCAEREYTGLARKIQENLVTVTPMNQEEMEAAITEPAKKVGLEIQRELVEQILTDMEGSPGILPLLQYTLTELWRRREVNRLTLAEYTKLGGVKGTLPKRADEVYGSLSDEEKITAKRIFLELTQLGEGTEDTRRQIFKSDLVTEKQSETLVDATLQKLADARLLVTSELQARGEKQKTVTVVDVAHEALIRHWPLLREWVNANREAIRIERRIEATAEEWESKKKPKDYLLVGSRLAEAENYIKDYSELGLLSNLGREFVDKSIKQQRFNRRRTIGIVAGVMALLTGFGGFAAVNWSAAEREKANAEATLLYISSQKLLASESELDALIDAIKAGKIIQKSGAEAVTKMQVLPWLAQLVHDVKSYNILQGHSEAVISVSFSTDGKTLASASGDNTIKLWSLDGKELATLKGHSYIVDSISFSPDGKTLASASRDQTIKLWSLDGKELATLTGHSGDVNSVSFSPDGKTIASGSGDKTIKLWSLDGKELATLKGHSGDVNSVSFSPDGKTIASGSWDKTIKLWSLDGKELATLKGHSSGVESVSFSPDGKTIASASWDKTIKLWSLDGKELATFKGHSEGVISVSFSPDGKTIASGSPDNTIKLWSLNGKELATLKGHSAGVISVSFSPDGKTIASGSLDNTIKLWSLDDQELDTLKGYVDLGMNSELEYMPSFSPDGKTLAFRSWDNTIKVWSLDGNGLATLKGHSEAVTNVSFSPDGKTIASGSLDKTIKLWSLDGKELATLKGHNEAVISISFSPDGKTLASVSQDKSIKLWSLDGKELTTLKGHSEAVTRVSFSPDGKTIASSSNDDSIKLWSLDGKELATLNRFIFSPDWKTLASGSLDNTIKLWSLNGKELATLKGHSEAVTSVSFSPDGKTIASGSLDNTIKLWSLDGKELATLKGHSNVVTTVRFSPDGKTLASASDDNTIKLWSLDGKELATLPGDIYRTFRISPDGKTIAFVNDDKETITLWNFDLDYLLGRSCNQLQYYLNNPNAKLSEENRHLCDDVKPSPLLLVQQGRYLARNGDIEGAVAKFQQAKQVNPNLNFNPETEAQQSAEEGRRLKALSLIELGRDFLYQRRIPEAIAVYKEAQKLDPNIEISASSWNSLCWSGSGNGYAKEVMFACEKAVALDPKDANYRDSRGLARALTGDTQKAIEDFQAFINYSADENRKSRRQRWINDLRAGKNPFTPEEIKTLYTPLPSAWVGSPPTPP